MIGWLRGEVLVTQPPYLLINVNGVGYEIQAPMTLFYSLPDQGAVSIFTHLAVREDAQQLFGFINEQERHVFRTLIKINGVGPKLALAILSSLDAQRLAQCINNHDIAILTSIPGVGKKTAERLLVELRDKLSVDDFSDANSGTMLASRSAVASHEQEAIDALISLGYKPKDAEKMIVSISDGENHKTETLIKMALKRTL